MRIIVTLPREEAERTIEDEEENIRPASQSIIRAIEDVCAIHQIRYESIEVEE